MEQLWGNSSRRWETSRVRKGRQKAGPRIKERGLRRGSSGDWLSFLRNAGGVAGLFSMKSRGATRTFAVQWFHSTHLCVSSGYHEWDWYLLSPAKKHQAGERSPCELLKPCYSPWHKLHRGQENLGLNFPKQPELNHTFSVLIQATHFSHKAKMEDVLSPPVDRIFQALLFGLRRVGARRPLLSCITVLSCSLNPVSLAGQKKLGIELTELWGSLAAPGSCPGCSGLVELPISCGTETTLLPEPLRDLAACLPACLHTEAAGSNPPLPFLTPSGVRAQPYRRWLHPAKLSHRAAASCR